MKFRLDRIEVGSFKRIATLELDLKPVTALIGGNTSGKSSALQAAQLGVSVLQAALKRVLPSGDGDFFSTVANEDVIFKPTSNLLELRKSFPCTQNAGYSISYSCVNLDDNKSIQTKLTLRRGKNANVSIDIEGDLKLAAALADQKNPFSILTPGLSGIPLREEWRTRGSMDAAVMHGDANMYLRTVLDHLFNQKLDIAEKQVWNTRHDINILPESGWKMFSILLDRCYSGARIIIEHDPFKQRYINVSVFFNDIRMTLDMASTGMLQVIQILAYACFYRPPLLLLDEPDAHLHADSQSRLYEALRGIADEDQTRILLASHSPQLIQRLLYDAKAEVVWMNNGAKVEVDASRRPAIPILMTLGALTSGAEVFDPGKKILILTEDKITGPVIKLAEASGAGNAVACISYNGCGNLLGARQLARIISDMRSDIEIYIHRDRDFRTDEEMDFEKKVFKKYCQTEKLERVYEIFTHHNDVEHAFCSPRHLAEVFPQIPLPDLESIVADTISKMRDDLLLAAKAAREKLETDLYKSERMRSKPEWAEANMPQKPPSFDKFKPSNGLEPIEFGLCHGKLLIKSLKVSLHTRLGGNTKDIENQIFSARHTVQDPNWAAAFAI